MHTLKVVTCLENIYTGHNPLGPFPAKVSFRGMGVLHHVLVQLLFISTAVVQGTILEGSCLWTVFSPNTQQQKKVHFVSPNILFCMHHFYDSFSLASVGCTLPSPRLLATLRICWYLCCF